MRKLLTPADTIKKQIETPKEYFEKSSAAIEQLAPGVEVIHPTFGKGVVDVVNGSGSSAAVTVRFAAFDEPKKLVYRFAKLVLA